jgi:hypothetical protein
MINETPHRCRARSSRTGEPCQHFPIRGGTVCRVHGGSAPQVQKAARQRILDLVDPALSTLEQLLDSRREDVRLGAVKDILDRAGYAAKQQVEITIREQAARLAEELGLDVNELIAEAERIVANSR